MTEISIMEIIETSRQLYGSFFPRSRKKREEFLGKVREKVELHQPKIEEKTGVSLGDIGVKDNREWLNDMTFYNAIKSAMETAEKRGTEMSIVDIQNEFPSAVVSQIVLFFPLVVFNTIRETDMRYAHGNIYVPFNYMNRLFDIDFVAREKRLDYGVIHELSHHLWYALDGSQSGFGEGRVWNEGFTTYCTEVYFSELLPDTGIIKIFERNLPSVYRRGKKKIENLVSEKGEDALLEVPKRWKEFSKLDIYENS